MLYHQLPIELFSRIAKEAVNMEVEEYGPSEHEFLWGLQDANPNYRWPPRVREVLRQLGLPPLSCGPCRDLRGRDVVCERVLHRARGNILSWREVCPRCGL